MSVILQTRAIYVRNSRSEWWTGSGHWRAEFGADALHFETEYYAWADVGRFADDGTHLVEQGDDGEWRRLPER